MYEHYRNSHMYKVHNYYISIHFKRKRINSLKLLSIQQKPLSLHWKVQTNSLVLMKASSQRASENKNMFALFLTQVFFCMMLSINIFSTFFRVFFSHFLLYSKIGKERKFGIILILILRLSP